MLAIIWYLILTYLLHRPPCDVAIVELVVVVVVVVTVVFEVEKEEDVAVFAVNGFAGSSFFAKLN